MKKLYICTTNIKNKSIMKRIYLVFENGDGAIHKAFSNKLSAQNYIDILKEQTDLDCYEIIEINLED